jgi:hypothetical protein
MDWDPETYMVAGVGFPCCALSCGFTTGAGVDVCSALARLAAASPTTRLVRHNAPGAGRAAALAFRRARV